MRQVETALRSPTMGRSWSAIASPWHTVGTARLWRAVPLSPVHLSISSRVSQAHPIQEVQVPTSDVCWA